MINMGMFEDIVGLFKRPLRQTDYEEDEDTEMSGMAQTVEPKDYGNNELNFCSDVASSQLLPGLLALIHSQTNITESAKQGLIVTTAQIMGKDMLYANNNPTQIGKGKIRDNLHIKSLKIDMMLGKLVTWFTKSDLENFNLAGFITVFKNNSDDLLSRTIGSDRERKILTEFKTTLTSISGTIPKEQKPPEKKKNWLGF